MIQSAARYEELTVRRASALGLVLIAAALGACGQAQATISTPAGTVTAKQSGQEASVTVQTGKGTDTVQAGSKLPSGFPVSIPLPGAGHISSAIANSQNGKTSYLVVFTLNESLSAGLSAYDTKLKEASFNESANFEVSGTSQSTGSAIQSWTNSTWTIGVVGAGATPATPASLTITVKSAAAG